MKSKKLNLNKLKVDSFVTSIKEVNVETIKGGVSILLLDPDNTMCCSYFMKCIPSFNPGCAPESVGCSVGECHTYTF